MMKNKIDDREKGDCHGSLGRRYLADSLKAGLERQQKAIEACHAHKE